MWRSRVVCFTLQPMPKLEWNDPSFFYSISYMRADQANQKLISVQIFEQFQWHYLVLEKFSEPYIPFSLSVAAGNSQGSAVVPAQWIIGRSGDDSKYFAMRNLVHVQGIFVILLRREAV